MPWTPSNEPHHYDEERVERLQPARDAIEDLALPLSRYRKLNGIVNVVEVQIEDGGDSPEVNALLLDALRAAIRHQVGEKAGAAALRAIDGFAEAEAQHWEEVRAGRYQAPAAQPAARIERLVYEAHDLVEEKDPVGASDRFLEAWEIVKELTTPEIRALEAFDAAQDVPHLDATYWVVDLQYELWNAGLKDPVYHEHRVRLAEEVLTLFPDSTDNTVVNMRRGQADSLWELGRRDETEAIYAELAECFPHDGFVYAGWADLYSFGDRHRTTHDYPRAEAILKRALQQQGLEDRDIVLERLSMLYGEWGKPAEQAAAEAEAQAVRTGRPVPAKPTTRQAPPPDKPGRNDPCWCGSGKKYKHCHMHADRLAED